MGERSELAKEASNSPLLLLIGGLFAVAMLFLSTILARDQGEIDKLTMLLDNQLQVTAMQSARIDANEKRITLLESQEASIDRRVQAIEIGSGNKAGPR